VSYENATDLEAQSGAAARPTSPFGWLVDGMNGVGSLLIFAVMLLICADVLARDLFNSPIHGVSELVALSIIAIVFLQLASTLRHGRMSRAELFIDEFKVRRPFAGHLLQAIFDLCGVAACGIIVYATWPILQRAWTGAEFIGVQGVFTAPTWPVKAIVLVGAAITVLQYLVHFRASLAAAFAAPPR
jgi:TRAP-type mannitol/chloroaromatic compound transport system permease small subunit